MSYSENDLNSSCLQKLYFFSKKGSLQSYSWYLLVSIIRPARERLSSRWPGITRTAQCQLDALFSHQIQDELLALNTYRKDKPKLGLNNFKALLNRNQREA